MTGTSIIFSAALQAPIALSNPSGAVNIAGNAPVITAQYQPVIGQGNLSVLGTAVRLGLTIAPNTGAALTSASAPTITSGLVTPQAPIVGALSLSGVAPTVTVSAGTTWQLAIGHYIPSVAAPMIIAPRPDTETQSWERNRLCPAGKPWRFPITLLFGAWPFRFDVISGPAGLSIGNTYGQANYGVLNWANPVAGTYSITVQVTTQDFGRTSPTAPDPTGQYQVTWTLEVAPISDSRFVWLDAANGSDANPGTNAAPWKTLAGFAAASTSAKQLFLAAGTYNINVLTSALDLTNRAKVWVGMPGSFPEINYGGVWGGVSCYIGFVGPGCSASNINFFGSPSNFAGGSADIYHITNSGDRGVYYENTFDSLNALGAVPGNFSNWCAIGMFANSAMHNYVVSMNNVIQNFQQIYSGGAHVWFSTRYWAIEGCTIQGFTNATNIQQGFISKGHNSFGTIRNNHIPLQAITTAPVYQSQGPDGNSGDNPNSNETCWNYAVNQPPGNNGALGSACIYGLATFAAWTGWIYRNTIIGANYLNCNGITGCSLLVQSNVVCSEHGTLNDADHYGSTGPLAITAVSNVVGTFSGRNSVVDPTTGYLLPAYAAANGITIGTVGHQVA